jgi:DNA-binding MarR family transcriptional regulator
LKRPAIASTQGEMADHVDSGRETAGAALAPGDLTTLVELLFFAYRDFTGEADATLAEYGLGRAHHRVLHFVRRHPGLSVTELLAILKITKQSLGRVLTPLVEDGWVDSRRDPDDQRARMLFLTDKGAALAARLVQSQLARMSGALGRSSCEGTADERHVRRFLFAMIAPEDQGQVMTLLAKARMDDTRIEDSRTDDDRLTSAVRA